MILCKDEGFKEKMHFLIGKKTLDLTHPRMNIIKLLTWPVWKGTIRNWKAEVVFYQVTENSWAFSKELSWSNLENIKTWHNNFWFRLPGLSSFLVSNWFCSYFFKFVMLQSFMSRLSGLCSVGSWKVKNPKLHRFFFFLLVLILTTALLLHGRWS